MKRFILVLLSFIIMITAGCSNTAKTTDVTANSEHTASKENPKSLGSTDSQAAGLDLGKEDNTRITIALSGPENRFIETAVESFQKSNPGIVVEIKQYTTIGETITGKAENGATLAISENTDPGGAKYIKKISTELMSGGGPDIIDTFYIPVGKFAENGYLCDLGAIIKQDANFGKSNYYENILESGRYKDGLYSIPISFLTNCIIGVHSLPTDAAADKLTFDGFFKSAGQALTKSGVKGSYVLHDTDNELFEELFFMYYGEFINQENNKCDFTSGKFVQLITKIKEATDNKLIFRREDIKNNNSTDLYFIDQLNSDSYVLNNFKKPQGSNNSYALPTLEGNRNINAETYWKYGINKNSKSKGAAWKFIKYLISEEMQSSPEFYSFPVNKKAMAKKLEREKLKDKSNVITADDPILSDMYVNPARNWQVADLVQQEVRKYFDGQRSAEDTASILQSRVNIILNE